MSKSIEILPKWRNFAQSCHTAKDIEWDRYSERNRKGDRNREMIIVRRREREWEKGEDSFEWVLCLPREREREWKGRESKEERERELPGVSIWVCKRESKMEGDVDRLIS